MPAFSGSHGGMSMRSAKLTPLVPCTTLSPKTPITGRPPCNSLPLQPRELVWKAR
jgi:hypothetical protein